MASVVLTWKNRCLWLSHVMFQQILAIVLFNILWIVYSNYDLSKLSPYHVIFCVLGYAFFMAEAIALFAMYSVPTLGLPRGLKANIHGALMGLGVVSLTIGISIKIYQKNSNSIDHFVSSHAILGLSSWILTFLAVIFGIISANLQIFKQYIPPVFAKLIHTFLGASAFVLGIVCLGFGLDKIRFYSTDDTILLTIILMGIFTAYSLAGPIKTAYEQIRSILDR